MKFVYGIFLLFYAQCIYAPLKPDANQKLQPKLQPQPKPPIPKIFLSQIPPVVDLGEAGLRKLEWQNKTSEELRKQAILNAYCQSQKNLTRLDPKNDSTKSEVEDLGTTTP